MVTAHVRLSQCYKEHIVMRLWMMPVIQGKCIHLFKRSKYEENRLVTASGEEGGGQKEIVRELKECTPLGLYSLFTQCPGVEEVCL